LPSYMRRRRFIGVNRGLRKSMGCAAAPWFALQRRPMRDWLDQTQKVAIRRAALPINRCRPVVAVSRARDNPSMIV
jgi:hypothetical protein